MGTVGGGGLILVGLIMCAFCFMITKDSDNGKDDNISQQGYGCIATFTKLLIRFAGLLVLVMFTLEAFGVDVMNTIAPR